MKYLNNFCNSKPILEKLILTELVENEYDFFHISTTKLGNKFIFNPRIPEMPFTDDEGDIIEDNFTYRISLAKTIKNCLEAITDEEVDGYYVYGVKIDSMDFNKLLDLSNVDCPIGYGEDFVLRDWLDDNNIEGKYYSVGDLPIEYRDKFYGCVPDVVNTNEFWYLGDLDMEYLGEVRPWQYGDKNLIIESMKHLKKFNEDITDIDNVSDINISFIGEFLRVYVKGEYTIEEDGRYSVDGDVAISNYRRKELPISFSKVTGSFHVVNSDITDFEGFPYNVGETLYVFGCEYISSMVGCPEYVGGNFFVTNCYLSKIDFCPKYVGGEVSFNKNRIQEILAFPEIIRGGNINFNTNNLFSVDFDKFNLKNSNVRSIFLKHNNIESLINVPYGYKITLDNNCLPEQIQKYLNVKEYNQDIINGLSEYDIWNSKGEINIDRYDLFIRDFNL